MNDQQPDILATTAAPAKLLVDHFVSLASGAERDEWVAKYVAVQIALAEGRFEDAVRAHWKSVGELPKWAASWEMRNRIEAAMNNLARELKLPNGGVLEVRLGDLPTAIDQFGVRENEYEYEDDELSEEESTSFSLDPLESDPKFAQVLAAADRQVETELQNHSMNGRLGFCHVYWERKKAILKQNYGLDWQTPAELNLDTIFE